MNSLRDEVSFMLGDKGGKYYMVAFIVACVVIVLFSQVFSHNHIEDGKIVIIDMDHSAYSRQLIEKLDASQYISVEGVLHSTVNPEEILYHDEYLGVIYLPHGLEARKFQYLPNQIGMFLDNTNLAATANLRTAIMEIITAENMDIAFPKVKQLGLSDDQAGGVIANMAVEERLLFNPEGSYINTMVMGFLNLYSGMFYCFAVLPIIARLRMENKWHGEILKGSPFSLMQRILPYAACFSTALVFGFGVLKTGFGFRFAGSVVGFLISIVLYTVSTGLLCMIFSWGAKHPGEAIRKMMFVIVPGFILGGVALPQALLPNWVAMVSNGFPMVWFFRFVRGVGLRGADLSYMWRELGGFILYVCILAGILVFRLYQERQKLARQKEDLPDSCCQAS